MYNLIEISSKNIDKIIEDFEIFIDESYDRFENNVKVLRDVTVLIKSVLDKQNTLNPPKYKTIQDSQLYEKEIFVIRMKLVNLTYDIISSKIGLEYINNYQTFKTSIKNKTPELILELNNKKDKYGTISMYNKILKKLEDFNVIISNL